MSLSFLYAALSFLGGVLIGYFVLRIGKYDEAAKRKKGEQKLSYAKAEAEKLLKAAREEIQKLREHTTREISRFEEQDKRLEIMLQSKEQLLKKKEERAQQFAKALQEEKTLVEKRRAETKAFEKQIETLLFQRAALSKEELRKQVIETHERDWQTDSENRLHRLEAWMKEDAARIAKNILEEISYRYADVSSVERREGVITVDHDHLKEKILGPNGKTLIALEKLFDMDIVLNDRPNTISFSAFNVVTRETGKLTIERLLKEKVVNEAIVQQAYELAKQDMEKLLFQEGSDIAKKLNLKNIPPDLIRLVGRLNYRTSYGQNIMRHSLEVGYFARLLAGEIGANEEVTFLGGFFHDIGKAIDQEVGGSHDVLSKEILEKYNFSWEIVHAAWTHHDAIPQETVEAVLVKAADAISAGRPGARSLSIEQYIEKIRELEATASAFEGVKKAFAISAGREVRIMTDPEVILDEDVQELAEVIADKIEEKGGYPGKIKVTTIRVTKASDIAKQKMGRKY